MTTADTITPPPRRRVGLVFQNLAEVWDDVQRLQSGCTVVGTWSLGQVCRHLADSINGSMDGFGTQRHRVMRWFFGRRALRQVFRSNSLGQGFTVTEELNPPPAEDANEAVAALGRAIERYVAHTGPLHFHPFFGTLTRSEWDRLHCIHAAHHLRALRPHRA